MKKMCAGALAAIMLAGCGGGGEKAAPAGTATSPVAVPSAATSKSGPMVTPNGTLDPSMQATTNPSTDPLYLEAVKVYKAYFAEMQKIEAAGYPSDTLPPVMDQYITGEMKRAVEQAVRESRAKGVMLRPGQSGELAAIAPNPGVSMDGSIANIRVCADASKAVVIDKKTQRAVGRGTLIYKQVYFQRFSGVLKGFHSESEQVAKCPI